MFQAAQKGMYFPNWCSTKFVNLPTITICYKILTGSLVTSIGFANVESEYIEPNIPICKSGLS